MPKFLFRLGEDREEPKSFKKLAMKDHNIQRLYEMKDEGAYKINTRELIDEVEDLHLSRKYKSFKANEILQSAQRKLAEWTAEINQKRGRATTIKMLCTKVKHLLQNQLNAIRSYLRVHYKKELQREYNRVDDKKAAIEEILEPFMKFLSKLDTVLALCDILIEDIDKSHWHKESMIAILNMHYGKAT